MPEFTFLDLRPTGSCPKCGVVQPFERPRYVPENSYGDQWHGDYLAWECRWCGYIVQTETVQDMKPR